MKIKSEILDCLLLDTLGINLTMDECKRFTIISHDEYIEKKRWYTKFRAILKDNDSNKYYEVFYEEGNTEIQESSLFADYNEYTEMQEVEPVVELVEVTSYIPKKNK